MTAWLIRTFIHNASDVENSDVRTAYGTLASITGVLVTWCCPAQNSCWACSPAP